MFNKIVLYLKNFDWILLAAVLMLVFFGLAEIYSIALGNEDAEMLNFKKQLVFVLIGVIALFLFSFIDYYSLRSFSNYFYIIGVILLVAVLFFGHTVRGTRGWFSFAGLSMQPVEFVKFILIIFIAQYFSGVSIKIKPLKHLIISGIGSLVFIFLVLKQPDFGSALILSLFWIVMLFISGFKKRYFVAIFLIASVIFTLSWFLFFKDYQKQRIITFINPGGNALDEDYNIVQATIAIGSGGLVGRGIGFGSQSQLKFLPESQNDFIFAVISEELGLLGVVIMLGFFALLFYRLINGARRVNNDFGIYFLIGVAVLIFIEMFINMGMNIGLLPVVGISLPFISYGGSAILSSLMLIGVAESIIIRSRLSA